LRDSLAAEQAWAGSDCAWRWLDADELRGRVAVDGGRGALFTPYCARVQPARLVRGVAEAAVRTGAVVHEGTAALSVGRGRVVTAFGEVRARHVLVCTEGYTANLAGRRRSLLPLNSAMIITEPLGDARWAQLGWQGAETLLDGSHVYTYSQRTADGRIAIGGRGVPYRFGSQTDREGPVPARTVRELQARLVSLFGAPGDVPVARAWHGVLGVARDWCPTVGYDARTGLGFAGGYAGEGVAASNLAARTLRDLVLGPRDSSLARLPWVGRVPRSWEVEPLRFLGARGIYGLYRLADRRELRRGAGQRLAGVANVIAGR
jgi:glycine/D-amino acid oxidase-like deaminating enzyme